MLGNTETILVEGLAKDGINLQGRSANNRVIHLEAPDQNKDDWIGKMIEVKIIEVLNYTLRGELIESHVH
jgi:tRNA-2-methylthio-N6-dimethylallyladenosine synthase